MFERCVVGQERAVSFLMQLLQGGRIPHSLLLYGPEGIGKAAAALEFARALHCEREEQGACGNCPDCRKTAALNHPGLLLLFPFLSSTKEAERREILQEVMVRPYDYPLPQETRNISIKQVRDLQKQFAYGTHEGRRRTAVILHADRMRPEAANALLKTLEEPPARSLLILTAPSLESLLPTIVSRCQLLKFHRLSTQTVAKTLMDGDGIDADRTWSIAHACGGNLRRAREMAAAEAEDVLDLAYRFWEALVWEEEPKTLAALEHLATDRQRAFRVLRGAGVWLRDVLAYQNGQGVQISNRGRLEDIQRLSEVFDLERLHRAAQGIEWLREMSRRNVNLCVGLISLWRLVRPYAVGASASRALRA